jgi:hypothetical protein
MKTALESIISDRPLKFRIWDCLTKCMIYPDQGYQGHFILSLSGQFHNLQNGSGGKETVVSQFTGYRDTTGRDIYEGDIVVAPDKAPLTVRFHNGQYEPKLDGAQVKVIGHIFDSQPDF